MSTLQYNVVLKIKHSKCLDEPHRYSCHIGKVLLSIPQNAKRILNRQELGENSGYVLCQFAPTSCNCQVCVLFTDGHCKCSTIVLKHDLQDGPLGLE